MGKVASSANGEKDVDLKSCVLLGKIDNQDAIITVNKTPVCNLETIASKLEGAKLLEENGIYTWFTANCTTDQPDLKLYLIYPATASHVSKYTVHKSVLARETQDLYEKVTLPWINSLSKEKIAWVYNILHHKKETESIVYEIPDQQEGFILLPDSKWDQTTIENMYLQAIFHAHHLKCLRDLRGTHIAMLKRFQRQVSHVVKSKYGVLHGEFRMYIHYQPTYYHLHVHVSHLKQGQNAFGTSIGKAHLLDDVIQNLEMDGDYYKKRTMYYTIGADDTPEGVGGLWQAFVRAGLSQELLQGYSA